MPASSITGVDTGILTPPPEDLTVKLLNQLFGPGWHDILQMETLSGDSIFISLLNSFNMVVLAALGALVTYVLMVGIVGTSHEGTPLGKRYSTLWTPLRGVGAVTLLMPLPWAKGLSLMQATLMLFIYWGIGGAGHLSSTSIDYMVGHSGRVVAHLPTAETDRLAKNLIKAQIVQVYMQNSMGLEVPALTVTPKNGFGMTVDTTPDDSGDSDDPESLSGLKWVDTSDVPAGKWIIQFHPGKGLGLSRSDMGSVVIPCPSGLDSPMCTAKKDAVLGMINSLWGPANKITSAFAGGADQPPNFNSLTDAVRDFDAAIDVVVDDEVNNHNARYVESLHGFAETSKRMGWAGIGYWYWTIAKFNEEAATSISTPPAFKEMNLEKIGDVTDRELVGYLEMGDEYADLTISELQRTARGPMEQDGVWGMLTSYISRPFVGINPTDWFTEGDPVVNMQNMGHVVLDGAYVGMAGVVGAKVAAQVSSDVANEGLTGTLLNFVPGGAVISKGIKAIALALETLAPMIIMALIALIFLGITLAFYLPAVPFVLWTMALVGWLIQVVEVLVAAPLWAAAHAIPEGEGMAGQHGKQGYMLFLGVLMKPPLMVFGFFSSYLLIAIVGQMIGIGFQIFTAGQQAGHASGPVAFIALTFILGSVMLIVSHKLFGLITWLPENVLRWVGQQVQNLGESGDEGRSRGAFAGMISKGEGAAGRGAGQGLASGSSGGKPPTKTALDNLKTPGEASNSRMSSSMDVGDSVPTGGNTSSKEGNDTFID